MLRVRLRTLLALMVLLDWTACNARLGAVETVAAKPPAEALATIKVRPGFKAELVASEPLIEDPVAFDWGADGQLWVVEMRDYPLGMDNKGKPGGRVVTLKDTDGDGVYDKSQVFLDNLLFPSGIMTWRRGALITCAPDIFYAEDTDGVGRADKTELLFTGFGEANPQHRVNGLRWGFEGWVYCANGDFAISRDMAPQVTEKQNREGFSPTQAEDLRRLEMAGSGITSVKTGQKTSIRSRDFRIRPDDGLLDPQSGQAQFGRDRTDWGDWFGCNHASPLWHFVLDDYYLRRNPYVSYPSLHIPMPASVTHAIGPIGRATGSGRDPQGNAFTSACGIGFYRDDLFGGDFANSWFVCEPVHNLIHRELLVPDGVTFTSRRVDDERASEFLASSDTMFTPVSIRTAPDGTLWIADMYRAVLEHPHWLPSDWETRFDVRAGEGLGRIYRVLPTNVKPRAIPNLAKLDDADLVHELENPNGWIRDKVQQLILERRAESVALQLERIVTESDRPQARLHALCTLRLLGILRQPMLLVALQDAHPGVRRQAIRCCETFPDWTPAIVEQLVALASDQDAAVRMQLAYTLGTGKSKSSAELLGGLMIASANDPYITAAAISSVNRNNISVVAGRVGKSTDSLPATAYLGLLRSAQGYKDWETFARLLATLTRSTNGDHSAAQFTVLGEWLDSLALGATSFEDLHKLPNENVRGQLSAMQALFRDARAIAIAIDRPAELRIAALKLLGHAAGDAEKDAETLATLLSPQTASEVQSAAAAALGRLDSSKSAPILVANWNSLTPSLRGQLIEAFFSQPAGVMKILDAIEGGNIAPQDISLAAQQRLLTLPDNAVVDRARNVFAERVDANRDKVVRAYLDVAELQGNSAHGIQLFAKNCSSCHQLGVVGTTVGPNLAMTQDKPADWFLTAILDPSRAVDAKYLSYTAITTGGTAIAGVPAEESGTSVTLVDAQGNPHVILRTDIELISSTNKSLMPEGFENQLSKQDLADVIAFVRQPHPTPKAIEFNHPQIVRPLTDGTIHLSASNCEVFGDEIHIWDLYHCLGWWTSDNDKAQWTVQTAAPGAYALAMEWSCDDGSAGNKWQIEAGATKLTGTVESTGGWEKYRNEDLGIVELPAGVSTVAIRSQGDIRRGSYLFDLRGFTLRPVAAK
jgi:putative membrane-bound dehydrogenase-like protein